MTATTPLAAACTGCGRRVLEVRWDHRDDVLIGAPRIDGVSLDWQQVTACVLAGITLWQIHEWAGRVVTSRRTRYWPTKPIPGHIAPEHHCARTWDAFPLDLAPAETVTPDQPPF